MASSLSHGAMWSHEEILALIRTWSDRTVQESFNSNTRRNAETYRKITEELNNLGYTRTQAQVNAKLKNLKQFYKDIKSGHEKSGYNRDNWPYFDLIDAVLGDRPSTMPVHVIDTTEPPPPPKMTRSVKMSTWKMIRVFLVPLLPIHPVLTWIMRRKMLMMMMWMKWNQRLLEQAVASTQHQLSVTGATKQQQQLQLVSDQRRQGLKGPCLLSLMLSCNINLKWKRE